MNTEQQFVCLLDEIKEPGSKGFSIGDDKTVNMFVVRSHGQVFAYQNRCPHTGAPLEWQVDQFLDFEDKFIQCAMHGALFEIDNGKCVRGPCAGNSLQAVALEIKGNKVFLVKNEETKTFTTPV